MEQQIITEDNLIKQNPYNYIREYYEDLYLHMGKKVMSVLSLVPCSLVLPKFIDAGGKKTITRISYLLLSKPGTSKTSLSQHFSKFTLNPFNFEYITDASLSSFLDGKEKVTVITSDIARLFNIPMLAKLIENLIGDEGKLSRFTKRSKKMEETLIDAVSYFSGTPQNLSHTISDGLLFRVHPQIIEHTEQEHEDILNKINNRIGNGNIEEKNNNKEEIIINYYKKLYEIQENNSDIEPIVEYDIPSYFRDEIKQKIIPLFREPFKVTGFEFHRELNQCYKYMVSHAFLNIYKRKVENGKLFLEDIDLRVAMALTQEELKTKTSILDCLNIINTNRIRISFDLDIWMKRNPGRTTRFQYFIINEMLKPKL